MNKKENSILEELLKQIPDLKKDEKKIEKIIEIFTQNNPEIKIDKNFKQNLKFRLDSIMEYKKETKKTFFSRLFLVPVFSVFLIIGGVFYIYKDITLLEQNNIKYENTQILDEIKNIEEQSEEIIDYKNENPIINNFDKVNELKVNKTKINEIKKEYEKINEINKNKKIDLSKRNINEEKRNKVDIYETDKKIENDIEDNQITDLLGEDINNNLNSNNFDDENFDNSKIALPEAVTSSAENTIFYDNGNNEAYINSFYGYCEEYNSEILINEDKIRYCIIEEKICMESDYSDNTCKLTQKK